MVPFKAEFSKFWPGLYRSICWLKHRCSIKNRPWIHVFQKLSTWATVEVVLVLVSWLKKIWSFAWVENIKWILSKSFSFSSSDDFLLDSVLHRRVKFFALDRFFANFHHWIFDTNTSNFRKTQWKKIKIKNAYVKTYRIVNLTTKKFFRPEISLEPFRNLTIKMM